MTDIVKKLVAIVPPKPIMYHTMKTQFGSHSIMWHTMETSFGSHSVEKPAAEGRKSFKRFVKEAVGDVSWGGLKTTGKGPPKGTHGLPPLPAGMTTPYLEKQKAAAAKGLEWKPKAPEKKEAPADSYKNPYDGNAKLASSIHNAKKNFSAEDKDGIRKYSSGSRALNNALHSFHRTGKFKTGQTYGADGLARHTANRLDKAFENKKNWVGHDHEVFTGLKESPMHVIEHDKKNNPNADPNHVHVHLPAYTSTTTNMGIAKNFARTDDKYDKSGKKDSYGYPEYNHDGHILHIHVPGDHPSMSIKKHSYYNDEDEVLLHRGTRLKINTTPQDYVHKNGVKYKIWHADVVGHQPDELPKGKVK